MNKEAEEAVREVLETLGEVNRLFRNTATQLKRLPQVARVVTALEVMRYESGSCVEGYIDAELRDGNGISWRLDVSWDSDHWKIRGVLDRNSASGSEIVEQIPPEIVRRTADLPVALSRSAGRLVRLRSKEVATDDEQTVR